MARKYLVLIKFQLNTTEFDIRHLLNNVQQTRFDQSEAQWISSKINNHATKIVCQHERNRQIATIDFVFIAIQPEKYKRVNLNNESE